MLAPEEFTLLVKSTWGDRVFPIYAILHPLYTFLLQLAKEWINVARTFPGEVESGSIIFLYNGSTGIDKEIVIKYVSTVWVFCFGVLYLTPFIQKLPLQWRQSFCRSILPALSMNLSKILILSGTNL